MIGAVVLAAGASVRAGGRNKLLARDRGGVAMVGRVVQACCASRAGAVVVVTGHQAALVEAAVADAVGDARVRFVRAAGASAGMSVSLQAGIGALPGCADAALVCLGDMPLVGGAVMDLVMAAYAPAAGRLVVVPVCGGRRGNPVLWDRRFFPEIGGLAGDVGARGLLARHRDAVVELAVEHPGVLADFDSVEKVILFEEEAPPFV